MSKVLIRTKKPLEAIDFDRAEKWATITPAGKDSTGNTYKYVAESEDHGMSQLKLLGKCRDLPSIRAGDDISGEICFGPTGRSAGEIQYASGC